jgi:molybdopterin molybdotransferase
MKPFFIVQTVSQVRSYAEDIEVLPAETVPLDQARGRTLAEPVIAPTDLPGFNRATMDGYAVRGKDTFGTSEGTPGYLRMVGEVRMGEVPTVVVGPGDCATIGTGGMIPEGADAVMMVEHTRPAGEDAVEVCKPVAPGGHVLGARDDAAKGDPLLPAGQRLRAQDLGLLAALGLGEVSVVRRPRVGILSTGDEVIPIAQTPRPGQVRDVNTHTLAAQITTAGGLALPFGLFPDDAQALREGVAQALDQCDLLLLSGGSSMGTRDLTVEIFESFEGSRLLVHGVSVSPGKPFIWVQAAGKQLLGLPGQVTSCMITFHLFAEPILERLLGRPARAFVRFARQRATLTRNLPSVNGRQEYVRVRLDRGPDGDWRAEPLFGKSGLIRTLTQGHGLVRIEANSEGLDADSPVTVLLYPS